MTRIHATKHETEATIPSLPHFRLQLSSAFGGNLEPKCCQQFPLPFRHNDFCECDREREGDFAARAAVASPAAGGANPIGDY